MESKITPDVIDKAVKQITRDINELVGVILAQNELHKREIILKERELALKEKEILLKERELSK
jgi:hypothetical protein